MKLGTGILGLIKQSFVALTLLACAACVRPPQFVQDAGGIEGFRQRLVAAHPAGSKSSDLAEELRQLGFSVHRYPQIDLKTFRETGRHSYAAHYPGESCLESVRVEWKLDRNENIEEYERIVIAACPGP